MRDTLELNIRLLGLTPYMAIKSEVLKTLKDYKNDFLIHDKKVLTKKDCKDCILIVYKTGTHIIEYSDYLKALDICIKEPLGYTKYLLGSVQNCLLLSKILEGQLDTLEYIEENHKKETRIYFYNSIAWREIGFSHAYDLIECFSNKAIAIQKAARNKREAA